MRQDLISIGVEDGSESTLVGALRALTPPVKWNCRRWTRAYRL